MVISDMAPATTAAFTDHVRQITLIEAGRELALEVRNGWPLLKSSGQDARPFVRSWAEFSQVKRIKPKATRGRSVEFFVAAMGRRA